MFMKNFFQKSDASSRILGSSSRVLMIIIIIKTRSAKTKIERVLVDFRLSGRICLSLESKNFFRKSDALFRVLNNPSRILKIIIKTQSAKIKLERILTDFRLSGRIFSSPSDRKMFRRNPAFY